jgi:hypothetical protein
MRLLQSDTPQSGFPQIDVLCRWLSIILLLGCAACAPAATTISQPVVVPFPTVTQGRALTGDLPTLRAVGFENPFPAAIQPTPAPNRALCPAPDTTARLDPQPAAPRDTAAAINRFLSAGGSPAALDAALRTEWGVLGDSGFVRANFDMTGEGAPEVITSILTPSGGMLAIFGCVDGRTETLYEIVLSGGAPQILTTDDLNFDGIPELQFTSRSCARGDQDCTFRTQIVSWRPALGRVVNLLGEPILSSAPPRVEDVDQDQVMELVIRFDDDGNAATGPRRTGIGVYDWNGAGYVRALTQLDPPRYRIQVVHLADAAFRGDAYEEAAALFQLVLNDTSLRNWQNDDGGVLPPYAAYRLLLIYSALEDERRTALMQVLQTQFPDEAAAPVYIQLAFRFWNALQVTNNLRSACAEVQGIISTRPEAVSLLNRYGSESPVYAAGDICPF